MVEAVIYYNHSRGVDQRPRKALHDLLNALSRRRGRGWRSNRGKFGVMGSIPILDERKQVQFPSVPHGGEIPPTLPR
jgi:hypothetical protein